jgi:hypothetical protein
MMRLGCSGGPRAASTTLHFCCASSRAVAAPIPLEAPVTTAVLPASVKAPPSELRAVRGG